MPSELGKELWGRKHCPAAGTHTPVAGARLHSVHRGGNKAQGWRDTDGSSDRSTHCPTLSLTFSFSPRSAGLSPPHHGRPQQGLVTVTPCLTLALSMVIAVPHTEDISSRRSGLEANAHLPGHQSWWPYAWTPPSLLSPHGLRPLAEHWLPSSMIPAQVNEKHMDPVSLKSHVVQQMSRRLRSNTLKNFSRFKI